MWRSVNARPIARSHLRRKIAGTNHRQARLLSAWLPHSPTPLTASAKTVTALFADIKGSMELMEDLDPEEARAIIDPALKLMIDAAIDTTGT
jgi:class 3 adenylate cyclase